MVTSILGGPPQKTGLKKKKKAGGEGAAEAAVGTVSNPLFESMEGMLKQLSQQGAGAGKGGPDVRVRNGRGTRFLGYSFNIDFSWHVSLSCKQSDFRGLLPVGGTQQGYRNTILPSSFFLGLGLSQSRVCWNLSQLWWRCFIPPHRL